MPRRNKRRGRGTAAATLPLELVVEVAARSDAATLFRLAAACKLIRREILNPDFLGRVRDGGALPSRLLGFIHEPRSFSLVHPNTPAAASFAEDCLAPFVSRSLAGGFFLEKYRPLTSRGGLVLLERPYSHGRRSICEGARPPDLCVYDPMTGVRTFLPFPQDIVGRRLNQHEHAYVLLTAADGVGCSFLVLAVDIDGGYSEQREQCFTVQAASSDAGSDWVLAARAMCPGHALVRRNDGAVVLGGVVHWLITGMDGYDVLTYDAVGTKTVGVIEIPKDLGFYCGEVHLGSSPDGKLSLFGARGFAVSFWVRSDDGAWARQAEVDTAPILRPLLEERELEDEAGNGFYQWQGVKVKVIGDK